MATHLKRTESVVQPALFRFDEHFELQDLIGASRNSEVRRIAGRPTEMWHLTFVPQRSHCCVQTQVARNFGILRRNFNGCLEGLRT